MNKRTALNDQQWNTDRPDPTDERRSCCGCCGDSSEVSDREVRESAGATGTRKTVVETGETSLPPDRVGSRRMRDGA